MTEHQKALTQYAIKDPERFAKNMATAMEYLTKATATYMKPREDGEQPFGATDQLTDMMKTIARVSEYWLSDPGRALEAQSRLVGGWISLWGNFLRRMTGEKVEPVVKPDPRDKRFADPEWSENQFFDFIKQLYLLSSRWVDEMVKEAKDLDDRTRHKAEFYTQQIVNAVAPSNFLFLNPELIRETIQSNGENLARGMKMLAEDIAAGGGELRIRQTDSKRFKVGVNVAVTPGKVIAQNDICQIIQYEPTTEAVLARPLLVVPPWINKYYILDLNEEKSFIRWAVAQGHTVFVISWVNPDARLAQKTFEDYMREGVIYGLDIVQKATGADKLNVIGYCVGGTLLAATLAYLAGKGDNRIAAVTFFTTQVDFRHAGDLKVFIDENQLRSIERRMKEKGYLEGKKMAATFNMLRSNDLVWPYIVNNYMKGKEPIPFDLLYWNSDATRMPAANHAWYLRNCYLENKLSRGELELGGVKLDLSKVTVPIYNLAAREDHIAPARSVFVGSQFFGGPVKFVLAGSGHIAGVVNPPDKPKYQYWVDGPPEGTIEDWLKRAEEHKGSWWPDWHAWMEAQDSTRVPARKPGGGKLKPIEDAPGSYVAMQS